MDTHGHQTIALVGEKVLAPALKRAGRFGPDGASFRLGAFYLGNWLTDVSQVIDPDAYQKLSKRLEQVAEDLEANVSDLLSDVSAWVPAQLEPSIGELKGKLDDGVEEFKASINKLLGSGGDSQAAVGFRHLFRFLGYVKFVLDDQGQEGAMDKTSYYHVFDHCFTQYWAHEHMDRPILGSDEKGVFVESTQPKGPRSPTLKNTTPEHDVYEYLRDNIEIAAGLLASLDGGLDACRDTWAPATFAPGRTEFADSTGGRHAIGDDVPAWNLELAKLGHTLHAIEDFFSHTNFMSHASVALPEKYQQHERKRYSEVIARRLKRYKHGHPDEDWRSLPDESHIVSGYFDAPDTIISLAHAADEALFGELHPSMARRDDQIAGFSPRTWLRDTLDFVSDPQKIWDDYEERDEDRNKVVELMREQGGTALELAQGGHAPLNKTVTLVLAHGPVLKNMDPKAKEDFRLTVEQFSEGVGTGVTIYRAIKLLYQFVTNPLKFLAEFVESAVLEELAAHGKTYLRTKLFHLLGDRRVGSHSLMAKDNGPELFHDGSLSCAKAAHFRVCKQLVRHGKEKVVDVCRTGSERETTNVLYRGHWIDWLELLEQFLSHPMAGVDTERFKLDVPVQVTHMTRPGDTLQSLATQYNATLFRGHGPKKLTWQMIADINFPTEGLSDRERARRINRALRDGKGVPSGDGVNYAFAEQTRVVIPWQHHTIQMPKPNHQKPWWRDVVVHGYKRGQNNRRHQPLPVGHDRVLELAERADALMKGAGAPGGAVP